MDKIIAYMLAEDEGFGDITSNAVIEKDKIVNASIVSKDEGILAGIELIRDLFEEFGIEITLCLKEGVKISRNDLLISFRGDARTILLLERTALNLLMRMSGVASAAAEYADLVKEYDVRIAGTRKAKENTSFSKKIEIEVETLDDAIDCVKNGADIVMLDNMSGSEVKEVIDALEKLNIRQNSLIEVSGGITKNNILDYVEYGVDIISIGALTHSSRSLNFSLRIE